MLHAHHSEIRYITPFETTGTWPLKVNTVGFESIPAHSVYPTNGHPDGYGFHFERGRVLHEFQIVYITRGKGEFTSTHIQKQQISEGSAFFLFPGEWHTYRPLESTGWECYWIGFNSSILPEMLENNNLSSNNPILLLGYDEEIVGILKNILEISGSERPGYQQLLSGMAVHLIAYLIYRIKNNNWADKEVQTKIDKAKLIIRENIHAVIMPEELASSVNMSYTWFRRMFRQYSGLAPAQYITQLKIQKAKELLSVTNKTIKEIALEIGFESYDYFSTSFKKYTKMTPGEFRNLGRLQ